MSRRLIILVAFSVIASFAHGLVQAPEIIRACLNTADSVVTIDYQTTTDVCGSFNHHTIFGSETGSAFTPFYTQTNISATQAQFKLPNSNPTWSFYIVSAYLCNGTDSISSDTFYIDIDEPGVVSIDSVSIDISTQTPIIGWKPNPAADTKGYRIYKRSNAINTRLGDTSSTTYVAKNQSTTNKIQYTLSTFDSCNLFSSISNPHSPIVLDAELDTCSRSIRLSWTPYEGWTTDQQFLYTSLNSSPFSRSDLNTNATKYQYTNVGFGDSLCFYINARNTATPASSSSNISCVKMRDYILPITTYLSQVTVQSKGEIKLECLIEDYGTSDSVVLYRWDGNETRIGSAKLTNGIQFYSWSDQNVKTDNNVYSYRVRTFAPCIGATNATATGNSILLKLDGEQLTWNDYNNWDGDVAEYEILGLSSTWNTINYSNDLEYENYDTTIQCFQIKAIENPNQYGFSRTSLSNIVCARREPKFFVPSALNPLSPNHRLTLHGNSIDSTSFQMIIFNRWGEVIHKTTNLDEGWSVEPSENNIPIGVYFYDISIKDLTGRRHKLSGSVRVIR